MLGPRYKTVFIYTLGLNEILEIHVASNNNETWFVGRGKQNIRVEIRTQASFI